MNTLFQPLLKLLDSMIHPEIRRLGGVSLLRGRMLSFSCIMEFSAGLGLLAIYILTNKLSHPFYLICTVMSEAALFLLLNRTVRENILLSACNLIFVSVFLALAIVYQGRSLLAPGFLFFPMLMMPAILLCGRRVGLLVSAIIILVAILTHVSCHKYGSELPFKGDRVLGTGILLMSVLIINGLTLGLVLVYFKLLQESKEGSLKQREWLQRTARMQELLQLSSHFALQTNGPLDVVGTALHNLEEPLFKSMQPRVLLPLLEPLESGIQKLAAISRSFSLFSRRYLEEGVELTSINAVLQHVDTIYNAGPVLKRARLFWQRSQPDIVLNTQTAKLVMLLVSMLRRIDAEGGTKLTAVVLLEQAGVEILLGYSIASDLHNIGLSDSSTVVHDGELTEDLIQDLCTDLGIDRSQRFKGNQRIHRLLLLQTSCQPRAA